jgi:hypothetical protein
VSTYARLAELTVEIDEYRLERLEQTVSSGFTRVTTVVHLHGGGEEGVGEDVTYDVRDHDDHPELPLAGSRSLAELSGLLDGLELFGHEPAQAAFPDYRRWAYEAAALDLALRQAARSLARVLEREPRPMRFVVSTRLPDPPSADHLRAWLELYPELRFKLDPTSSWDESVVADVAALGVTDVVDFKGAYRGTPVDQAPDAALYGRVAAAFADAWIEDPALDDETDPVLEPYRDRITWDAPIHSVDDVLALPFAPRALNVKPSRFGSLRRLFDFYDFCTERRIRTYGGGQFELGPGRGQSQYLASLFHPDEPNDVAPGVYNSGGARPGLPESPLLVADAEQPGFRAR